MLAQVLEGSYSLAYGIKSMISIELPSAGANLLQGIIDLHVYASPCLYERAFHEIDLAFQARQAGYRGILVKCHHVPNPDRVQSAQKIVPDIGIYGGAVLNFTVGGLNPYAVEACIRFGGKIIWMPNIHAKNHIRIFGSGEYTTLVSKTPALLPPVTLDRGISVLDAEGQLLSEVHDILDLIAESDVILGSGHLAPEEVFPLVKEARRRGVRKILIQHPLELVTDWPVAAQVEIAKLGAVLEYNFSTCLSRPLHPARVAEVIRQVGIDHSVIASGLGQPYNVHPVEGMRQFICGLLSAGITQAEIRTMTVTKPSEMLSI